jgi:hypothetical protein
VWRESTGTERYHSVPKLKGSRKQAAARQKIPLASITKVIINQPVSPAEAIAIYEGANPQDLEIKRLEAQIRALMNLR